MAKDQLGLVLPMLAVLACLTRVRCPGHIFKQICSGFWLSEGRTFVCWLQREMAWPIISFVTQAFFQGTYEVRTNMPRFGAHQSAGSWHSPWQILRYDMGISAYYVFNLWLWAKQMNEPAVHILVSWWLNFDPPPSVRSLFCVSLSHLRIIMLFLKHLSHLSKKHLSHKKKVLIRAGTPRGCLLQMRRAQAARLRRPGPWG